ncbi:Transcription factor Sox-2 [Linnemannia hyalina]|uniref:Transcription factor Sox-2 n=1 Tax=Linnemannia hyalina TaxID=64524 RepID=A0A9P7Y1P9_9FUNG|nr:Transcription factor Sox-2 [Linnemannia hyalina]
MVYLASQGMALNPANHSSSSLSSAATNSDYSSFDLTTLGSSTSSLPLTPTPKPTQTSSSSSSSSYLESTDPYHHPIKLETIELSTYSIPSTSTIIHNTIPKKEKVPRPPNAFIIYRREHSAGYSKITAAELSKILGEQWANEPPERKAHYFKLAKAAEKEHALMFPYYKFTPAKRGTGRKAKTMRAAASAPLKTTPDSPKPRAYKPSPLSALAPAHFPLSISPQLSSSYLPTPMPSMHSSLGRGVSHSSAFPYTTTTAKNNTQASAHLARPGDVKDYCFHHSQSNRSDAQKPKPRHAAAPLRTRPSTSTTQDSYCHAAPGPLDPDMFPSLNFGFPHLLPQFGGVSSTSSLSPSGFSASSLLFDPVVPTTWQWTPPTPATPYQFTMPAMTPSSFHGRSQSSPMPLSQEMTHLVNLPAFDYFALQDPGRPTALSMNWPHMSPSITGTPLPIPDDVAATANGDDCAPTSYQWGVGAPVPASAWPSPEAIYGADLPVPVSPEFRASMNIPIPSVKQQHHHHYHHLHNYHNQIMPVNGSAASFSASMMAEQDMSISPVLSTCSSSYSSLYSLNEHQAHFPQHFLSGDLALDHTTSKTPMATARSAAADTSDVTLHDLEQKSAKLDAAATAAAAQVAGRSPISCKTFV